MPQTIRPDICVIGTGAGGLAAAAAAAAFAVPVVLIDNHNRLGAQSLGHGAMPPQALIAAAGRANAMREAARLGVRASRPDVDFAAVKARVRDAVAAIAPNATPERFTGLGVRVISAAARFTDPRTVAAGDVAIQARRFVLATGSSPVLPAIPGLADLPYLTAETMFDLAECPRRLIVVGAGSAGLELAQAFRRLGAEVVVLEAASALAGYDPECAAIALDGLAREGIKILAGVEIAHARRVLARIEVDVVTAAGRQTVEGTHLLVAAGRRPNIGDLDLDAAKIRYTPHGVAVGKRLRTSNKRVYAVGDVTGGAKSDHMANYHAELVIRHALFRQRVAVDHRTIPTVTFTDPELAQVGQIEDEARAHAGVVRILRWPFRETDASQATRATDGHIKIVTDRHGDILGVTIVGEGAGENITAWTLAISQKLNIRVFAGLVVPYSTHAEAGKRAAMTYFMRGLTSSRVRRIIGWLRRLG